MIVHTVGLKRQGVLCSFLGFLLLCPVLLHGQTIAPPSMTFQCTPDPIYVNAAAMCTAHVGGGATGNVAFTLVGSGLLATIPLDSNGDASASTGAFFPPPGVYTITGSYSGDSHYSPMQVQEGLTVYSGKVIVTSSTLTCSPWVVVVGNPVACTVNIPGGATGTVAFSVAGVPWATATLNTNGNAIVTGGLVNEPPGAYAIQATYSGDSNFSGFTTSTSMTVFSSKVQPYSQAQPYSMTVGCSPATLTVGQNGSCVIHVLGGATGTVDLYVHDQYFDTVTLDANGNATSTNMFSTLPVGTYAVNAIYNGDANFFSASAGTTVNIANQPGTPLVSSICSPAAISPGSGTDCTAQVSPGATGEILFYVSGHYWTTVTLNGNSTAIATSGLSNLPAGTYSVVAYYPGDANFATGSAGTTVPISVTKPQPQVTVSCTPAALVVGNVANCTSTVGSGATGAVLLQVSGQITAGLGLNTSGSVTFGDQFQGYSVGNYTVEAYYEGDSNFASAAAVSTVSVGSTQTTPPFSVLVSPTIIQNGGSINFSGQVGGGATGTVVVSGNGNYIATLPINQSGYINGASIINVVYDGVYDIGFAYSGDANFLPTTQTAQLTVSASLTPPPPVASVYSFSITDSYGNSGYDPTGNIRNYSDSINGTWSLLYDDLNRVDSATESPINHSNQFFCWDYDSFGNRITQAMSPASFQNLATCTPQSSALSQTLATTANYDTSGDNRITSVVGSAFAYAYDGAGNITDDGNSKYLYDGDNRLCAVNNYILGSMTQYIYDADGTRVGKGTITTFTCDLTSNGFILTNEYIPGPSGEQMTELDGQGNWIHTNAYAGAQLVATYANDGKGVHFNIPDWMGTKRLQTDYAGNPELTCTNNPFGDSVGTCYPAVTEQFFTGKERDTESGNDYFGARYYTSTTGRFTSPDPSTLVYADPTNPQSLNLYAYGLNNPLKFVDPTGLYPCTGTEATGNSESVVSTDGPQAAAENNPTPPCAIPVPTIVHQDGTVSYQETVEVSSAQSSDIALLGAGSGNTQQSARNAPAPSKGPCTSGPVNVSQNMQTAQQLANKFLYGTPGQAYNAAKTFINLVHTGGNWDPKSGPGGPTDINVAAGNINFGATCSQFGSNSTAGGVVCQVGAGLYQYHTQGHFGSPLFSKYHGDTPSDNMQIRQGLAIAKKGGC